MPHYTIAATGILSLVLSFFIIGVVISIIKKLMSFVLKMLIVVVIIILIIGALTSAAKYLINPTVYSKCLKYLVAAFHKNDLMLGAPAAVVIIVTLIIRNRYKSAKQQIRNLDRHWRAEKIVSKELRKLDNNKYTVINNVLLEKDRETDKIDHLIISEHVVFIIEAVDYTTTGSIGSIVTGSENDEWWKWSQGGNVYEVTNAVHDCKDHIQFISDVLSDHGSVKFHSVVTYIGDALAKISCSKADVDVVPVENLNEYVTSYQGKNTSTIDKVEISNQIHSKNVYSLKTLAKHKEQYWQKRRLENS
jgi:hypothetical protein